MRSLLKKFFFLFIFFPSFCFANSQAQALLNKMHSAMDDLSYVGTFVFMHNGEVQTMRVIHGSDKDGWAKEKIISLTGDAREVIKDDDMVTCIWPTKKLVVVETAQSAYGIPSSIADDILNIPLNYKIELLDKERVAGLDCKNIKIVPTDNFRYGYDLCINEDHGMLLKSQMIDSNNKHIEGMMFTTFQLREAIPEKVFEPSVNLDGYTWKTSNVEFGDSLRPDRSWKIENLPPGFTLSKMSKRLMSASTKPVQQMVFSDGIASVSVFISEPEPNQPLLQGSTKKGAINAFAKDLNSHQITVMGEVPEDTVKMIGSSIIYLNHSQ